MLLYVQMSLFDEADVILLLSVVNRFYHFSYDWKWNHNRCENNFSEAIYEAEEW